jgi:hypothetical protein
MGRAHVCFSDVEFVCVMAKQKKLRPYLFAAVWPPMSASSSSSAASGGALKVAVHKAGDGAVGPILGAWVVCNPPLLRKPKSPALFLLSLARPFPAAAAHPSPSPPLHTPPSVTSPAASFLQGPPPPSSLGATAASSASSTSASSSSSSSPFAELRFTYMRGAGEGRRAERRVLVGSNAEVAYEGKNFGDDVHKGVVKCVFFSNEAPMPPTPPPPDFSHPSQPHTHSPRPLSGTPSPSSTGSGSALTSTRRRPGALSWA